MKQLTQALLKVFEKELPPAQLGGVRHELLLLESITSKVNQWTGGVSDVIENADVKSGSGNVMLTRDGFLSYNLNTLTIHLDTDGDAFFGSNLASPNTTVLSVFSNAQTYNSESMGAGDVMMGSNSSGYANLLWDASEQQLKFRGGTTTRAYIDTDGNIQLRGGLVVGTAGSISSGQIAYDNGTGFWFEYNSGTPRLSIGNSAGNKMLWDGSTLSVVGSITATSGTIGGWTIGATSLTAGSGSSTVGLDSGGTNPAIYAGSATPASAPFRVTKAGVVTATSGAIGGWTLGSTSLVSGSGANTVGLDSGGSNPALYAGSATPGSAPFRVTQAGALTATSGAVGGWTLGSTSLVSGSGANTVGLDSGGSNPALYAGSATPGSAPFRVTQAGLLTSTSALIAGWTINSTQIKKTGVILDSATDVIYLGSGTPRLELDGGNKRIRTSTYSSGFQGFDIDGATGNAEFNNITARGLLKSAVFEKDVISSVGGTVAVLDSDTLASDMTALDSATITISGNTTFAANDILRIKDGTDDEWMTVTNAASAPTYTVTRDRAAAYASNANPAWKKGQAVVNYGASTEGGVILTSSLTGAPYLSIFTHAGSPWTTINEHAKFTPTVAKFGSAISAANTTSLSIFNSDQTHNGESMGAGDVLLGSNSSTFANVLWDVSAKQLKFRGGTTVQAYVDTDGTVYAGGGNVFLSADGLTLVTQASYADSGAIKFKSGSDVLTSLWNINVIRSSVNYNESYLASSSNSTYDNSRLILSARANSTSDKSEAFLIAGINPAPGDPSSESRARLLVKFDNGSNYVYVLDAGLNLGSSSEDTTTEGNLAMIGSIVDSTAIACRAYNSGNISTTSGTTEYLNLDSERFDNDTMHFTSAANLTGTVSKTAASNTLTGSGTSFTTELSVGQVISVPGGAVEERVVTAITNNTSLTVNGNWGNTASGQTAARVNKAIVFRKAGVYSVAGMLRFASNATGYRQASIFFSSGATENTAIAVQNAPANATVVHGLQVSTIYNFAQWDFVKLGALQTSGGALNVDAIGNYSPELSVARIA